MSIERQSVEGGCEARLSAENVRFRVYTPLGSFGLGDCRMSMTARIDGDGAVWLERITASGYSPCGDLRPCSPGGRDAPPWRSRILPDDGAVRMRVNVCLDTCVGWFEAPVDLSLILEDSALREVRAHDVAVGETGLEMDGRLTFRRKDLVVGG